MILSMALLKKQVFAGAVALAACMTANAQTYSTVTLPDLNTNLTTWTNGSVYAPIFPGAQVFDGVPFQLQTNAAGDNAFYNGTLDISTNIAHATTVDTLINTAFGAPGADVGSLTFTGSAGATYTVQLIEGGNVRDHYYGDFVNTTTAANTTQAVFGVNAPGNAHLDMQSFSLPAAFANQTLTSVVFQSNNGGSNGIPFLAGMTVAAVPEAGTWAMLLAGLGVIGAALRSREAKWGGMAPQRIA